MRFERAAAVRLGLVWWLDIGVSGRWTVRGDGGTPLREDAATLLSLMLFCQSKATCGVKNSPIGVSDPWFCRFMSRYCWGVGA